MCCLTVKFQINILRSGICLRTRNQVVWNDVPRRVRRILSVSIIAEVDHVSVLTIFAGLMLMASLWALWYSTSRFNTSTSLPYTLQGFPASFRTAVNPLSVSLTFKALYPGQTSCASTAAGSLTYGIRFAPTSTEAGIVKMSRNVVGVPSSVTVLTVCEACGAADPPRPFAELTDCCPWVNACNEKNEKDFLKKFLGAMAGKRESPQLWNPTRKATRSLRKLELGFTQLSSESPRGSSLRRPTRNISTQRVAERCTSLCRAERSPQRLPEKQ